MSLASNLSTSPSAWHPLLLSIARHSAAKDTQSYHVARRLPVHEQIAP